MKALLRKKHFRSFTGNAKTFLTHTDLRLQHQKIQLYYYYYYYFLKKKTMHEKHTQRQNLIVFIDFFQFVSDNFLNFLIFVKKILSRFCQDFYFNLVLLFKTFAAIYQFLIYYIPYFFVFFYLFIFLLFYIFFLFQ